MLDRVLRRIWLLGVPLGIVAAAVVVAFARPWQGAASRPPAAAPDGGPVMGGALFNGDGEGRQGAGACVERAVPLPLRHQAAVLSPRLRPVGELRQPL